MAGAASPVEREMAKSLARSISAEMSAWMKFSYYAESVLREESRRNENEFIRAGWQYRASILEPGIGSNTFKALRVQAQRWIEFSSSIQTENPATEQFLGTLGEVLDDPTTQELGAWVNEGTFPERWDGSLDSEADSTSDHGPMLAATDPEDDFGNLNWMLQRRDLPEPLSRYADFEELVQSDEDWFENSYWSKLIADSKDLNMSRDAAAMLRFSISDLVKDSVGVDGFSWVLSAGKHGYVAREAEVRYYDGAYDDLSSEELLDFIDQVTSNKRGYVATLTFIEVCWQLPVTMDKALAEDAILEFPGWEQEMREDISERVVSGLERSAKEAGDDHLLPNRHNLTRAFFYGYWMHILVELNPIGWAEGVGDDPRYQEMP